MEPESFSFILSQPLLLSVFSVENLALFGSFLLLLLLLAGSALISGSEVAFFSLSHNDFAQLREENSKPANRILLLQEKPRTLLATILITNNFINVAIVIISQYLIDSLLSDGVLNYWAQSIQAWPLFSTFTIDGLKRGLNISITVVGVTFLLVLFGEVAPKIYAKLNNIRLAKLMGRALIFLMRIFNPFSKLLVRGTNLIERRLERRTTASSIASKQEIDQAIELTVSHEQNARQEIDILKSIVKFGDVSVKQIMRARVDVIAIDFSTSFPELMQIVRQEGYSRLPVYKDDFDHITGLLYVKDLIGFMDEADDFEWQSLIQTNVLYVPEAKKIDDMLREFQSSRMHMAIVVDEYGGTSGIVTLEDILEEVIGDIRGEFDTDVELEFRQIDDRNFIIEGKTLLNDVCRLLQVDTNTFDDVRGDADSLAGLILELSGFLPRKGEIFYYNDFLFKIVSVTKRRIEQIQITLPDELALKSTA